MCGIAGFQGAFPAALLPEMARALAHRGPDGEGWTVQHPPGRPPAGLAHRRLAIIDLDARAAQPMTSVCAACGSAALADLALTYNGELYNYRELRAELLGRGHRFRSESDTEVLLHLYAELGPAMLSRLNGIFALALYDGRARGRAPGVEQGDVLLARDPLGVKPLYYAELPRGVLFASEIKALIRYEGLPRELDPSALHYHLAYIWTPAPRTLLRAVRKLPPGECMLLREGRVERHWRYWEVPFGREPLRASEAGVVEQVRAGVEGAVRRQLMADVPVGAFLSGGLDSSAIVAMMKRAAPHTRPVCYTIEFGAGGRIDGNPLDLPFAQLAAQALDVELRVVDVRPDVVHEMERLVWALDEPQADLAPMNALLIAEAARADGIPVLLSGTGGDDLFAGYRRHRALRLERYWAWLPDTARRGLGRGARAAADGRAGAMSATWVRRAVKAFVAADRPPDERLAAYLWWNEDGLRRSLYSPDLAAATAADATASPLVETLAQLPAGTDRLDRMLWLELQHFLGDHNLNYTDKTGMAASVEVRVPLLDLELVELASRIPAGLKQRGPGGKYALRRAMDGILPPAILDRPKTGFGVPLRRWLREDLREFVRDVLSPASLRARGLFEPRAVERLLRLDRDGRVDGAYTILALLFVELWCRQFIDGSPRRPHARAGVPA